MYRKIRPKIESSTLRPRHNVHRLGPRSQGNGRVSAGDLKLRMRFHQYMIEKKSKNGETISDGSIIQDDWLDWMILWKWAINNRDKNYLEIEQEPSDRAVLQLKQVFLGRTSLLCRRRKELAPGDAAIIIQTSYRAHLKRKSLILEQLPELATANTRLDKIRVFFNNYAYRRRLREDAEEWQIFAEKIIGLLLTTNAIEGVNVKIRVVKKIMMDEMEAMIDKIDPISVAETERKDISDHGADSESTVDQGTVLLRRAFSRRAGKKRDVLSPTDAAIKIQISFRAYLRRPSQVLRSQHELAVAKTKLKEIRDLFNDFPYRRSLSRDDEERQRFSEKIIVLILSIEGADTMIRFSKKTMGDELEAMLDVVQPVKLKVDEREREPMIDKIETNSMAEIEDLFDHGVVLLRRAFFRRGDKRKKLWPSVAAMKIQRFFKAYLRRIAAMKIQRFFRAHLRRIAAMNIQRFFRAHLRRIAAMKIQRFYRAHLGRIAAMKIQRFFRAHLRRIAATKLQRFFRAHLRRKSQALQSQKELAMAETKLEEIRGFFNDSAYRLCWAGMLMNARGLLRRSLCCFSDC